MDGGTMNSYQSRTPCTTSTCAFLRAKWRPAMAKKFRDLAKSTMSAAQQARALQRARSMRVEMHLADLRRARELSQAEMAEKLGVAQSEVSKVERRTDLYLSTLKKYIEAAGGHLEIVAHFPDSDVRISQFETLAGGD